MFRRFGLFFAVGAAVVLAGGLWMLVAGPERTFGAMSTIFALGFAWSSRFSLRLGNAVGHPATTPSPERPRPSRRRLARVHGLVLAYLVAAFLATMFAFGLVAASIIWGGTCLFTVALRAFARGQRKRRAQSKRA